MTRGEEDEEDFNEEDHQEEVLRVQQVGAQRPNLPQGLNVPATNAAGTVQKAIIDPQQLLVIELLEEDGSTKEHVVFLCRYLKVLDGKKEEVVGFEYLLDPEHQLASSVPKSKYEHTFERLIVDPNRLKKVRVFVAP